MEQFLLQVLTHKMNIRIHPDILKTRRYRCIRCGKCCRDMTVTISDREQDTITALEDWSQTPETKCLFVNHRLQHAMAKNIDGDCVLLDGDNLCVLHKRYGPETKPKGCRLYPFVLIPYDDHIKVGLRFDCPAVCQNEGDELSQYKAALNISKAIQTGNRPLPQVTSGFNATRESCDIVNGILLRIINDTNLPVLIKLHRMCLFLERLHRVNWNILPAEATSEILEAMEQELPCRKEDLVANRQPPERKVRILLGQVFYLLCHRPEIITATGQSWLTRTGKRFKSLRMARRLGKPSGILPPMHDNWPQCDIGDLERSFGPLPDSVDQLISEYLLCRIGSMSYCGNGFYGYDIVSGGRMLILAAVTIGWLMRIHAIQDGRRTLSLDDCRKAIICIDGNMGYAPALGAGPARMRLRYLSGHLDNLLDWYCS